MNRKACVILISLIALSIIIGCGDDGGGAVYTNLNPLIQVWFNQALDPVTVDSASFHVEGAESHRVEYVDSLKVINLYLEEILDPQSDYTVVVTTGIENTNGDGMFSAFSFSFTTGTLDEEQPGAAGKPGAHNGLLKPSAA